VSNPFLEENTMYLRLIVIAASALVGTLTTLVLHNQVQNVLAGRDAASPPLPLDNGYRPPSRRAPRPQLDLGSNAECVQQ